MADEERRDDETEVAGHLSEPQAASEEPADEGEPEVEAHIQFRNARMD